MKDNTITRQHVAGKGLILNEEGDVLLLQQSSEKEVDGANKYHLPGGMVEFGEKIEDALKREIYEEIGVEAEIGKLVSIKDWVSNIRGEVVQIYGVFYVCSILSYKFTLEEAEVQSYSWINMNNINDHSILEPSLSVVKSLLIKV